MKENPQRLRSMMQAMVRQLEAMDAVYPVRDGKTLEPVVPQRQEAASDPASSNQYRTTS